MGYEPAVDRIEEAKSARSRCKECGVAIEKGEVRFGAVLVEGHDFMEWYHLACARSRMAERLAPVLAASKLSSLPPPPDAELGRLIAVERAKGRASCRQCKQAIPAKSLRVAVRLDRDPANPEFAKNGFIHLVCARAFTRGADVAPYLAKRSTKLGKQDRTAMANVLAAVKLVAEDPRGKALAAAKSTSVLGDWLEEKHGIVLAELDLAQLAR